MLSRLSTALASVIILSLFAIIIEASDDYTVDYGTEETITAHTECRKVTNDSATGLDVYVPTQTLAEWTSFYGNPPSGVTAEDCTVPITVTAGANRNLCTLAGNPTTAGDYVFTIPAGTTINSSSNTTAALTVGSCWPAGSTVTIINDGNIYGKGGNGGGGGDYGDPGSAGAAGGMAINMGYPVTIDNTNGYIYGGGGGGGGGGSCATTRGTNSAASGGGGGQGSANSAGGAKGTGGATQSGGVPFNGTAGTASAPGTGGAAVGLGTGKTGKGGNGGAWGAAGAAGAKATAGCSAGAFNGGAGGAAGKAIDMNGHTITWLGGNTSARVKGAVSN